jgi:hypothetical protein
MINESNSNLGLLFTTHGNVMMIHDVCASIHFEDILRHVANMGTGGWSSETAVLLLFGDKLTKNG